MATGQALALVDAEAAQDAVEEAQPIRFLGQYRDSETGLHYNRFRYYDADIGRYISLDPIGLAGGSNSYQYAPNPSGWADPLGLSKVTCGCEGVNKLPDVIPEEFFKAKGGSDASDFLTPHSLKHAYNEAVLSTKNKTQFGENINVQALRQDTIDFPDYFSTDAHGITKYAKEYPFNISISDSPTGQMRVFVNSLVPDKSTQFPLFLKPKNE